MRVKPVAEFDGDIFPGFLNEGRKLSQSRHRHADCRSRDAETGIDGPSVVPYGRSRTPDMKFVLFEITGVACPPDGL